MALKKANHEERADLARLLADVALFSAHTLNKMVYSQKVAKDAVWGGNSIYAVQITKYQVYLGNSMAKIANQLDLEHSDGAHVGGGQEKGL